VRRTIFLFNTCIASAGYLIRILICVAFLFNHDEGYSSPIDTSVNSKSLFDKIAGIPQKDRVSKANDLYKSKEGLRRIAPSDAMAGLDKLVVLARNLHDKSLECAVFGMRADYYSVNQGFNNLSIGYYQKAIDFAIANKMPLETGLYYHKMGTYYNTFKHYAPACRYFLKAQDIFNQIGYDKVPIISIYLSEVATFYYQLGDYDNAKTNLEAALRLVENSRDKINITNTIGLIYRNYGQYPQAIDYFNKTINLAIVNKNYAWIAIARGNIGSVYFLEKQYQKALPYIEDDYNGSMKYGEVLNGTIALLRLVKINIDRKNFDEAETQLKAAEAAINSSINNKHDVLNIRVDYYDLKSQLLELQGKAAQSIIYRKKFELDKDSLIRRNNIAAVERVKLRYEIDKHNAQVNKLKTDAKVQSIEIKASIAVLGLLIIVSFMAYNNQRLKRRKVIAEKRIVDEELKNAEAALQSFTENLRQKNMLIENFKTEIQRLRAKSSGNTDAEHLEKLLEAHIMTDENWYDFKKLFSKVYPGFFINLSRNYPNLSATDTRLLSLIKLGLNNSEMANMLGITVEGIQKAKQRMRKKLDIATISDIDLGT